MSNPPTISDAQKLFKDQKSDKPVVSVSKKKKRFEELKKVHKKLIPHKKQSEFIKAKQFMRMWLSARRTGKTKCIILDDIWTIKNVAPHTDGCLIKVYPTKEKGIDLIFDELCTSLDREKLLTYESKSYGRIECINQCVILFRGLRNKEDAEKLRGDKDKSMTFDETQSMISKVLKYAIASPAIQALSDLMPFGSHLNLFGTPPPSIGHIFAKKFLENNPKVFKMKALMEDNPHYPEKSRDMVKEETKMFLGIPLDTPESEITDPFYRREIFGDCINDPHRIIFNKDYFKDYTYERLPPATDTDRYYMGVYVSKMGEVAVSVNRANPKSHNVYCIFEKEETYLSIQQIPALLRKVLEAYEIEKSKVTVYLSYPKGSESIARLLSTYYKAQMTTSEEFESKLFPLLAEKININMLLKNFKIKEDSLFIKGCDEVFWSEDRSDIDESVQNPIIYSQMLVWGDIYNKPPKEEEVEVIRDPAEIVRANLEARLLKGAS